MITPADARKRWRGVVVPLPTIFGEDGSLDLKATGDHVRWILDSGARAGNTLFLAGGSGGDFPMLSLEGSWSKSGQPTNGWVVSALM